MLKLLNNFLLSYIKFWYGTLTREQFEISKKELFLEITKVKEAILNSDFCNVFLRNRLGEVNEFISNSIKYFKEVLCNREVHWITIKLTILIYILVNVACICSEVYMGGPTVESTFIKGFENEIVIFFSLSMYLVYAGYLKLRKVFFNLSLVDIAIITKNNVFFLYLFIFLNSILEAKNWFWTYITNGDLGYVEHFCNFYIEHSIFNLFVIFYISFFSCLALFLSTNFIRNNNYNSVEYSILIGFCSFFLIIIQSVSNLFAFFIISECIFICSLGISAWVFSLDSSSVVYKYFLFNTFISCLTILGLFIVFAHFGTFCCDKIAFIYSTKCISKSLALNTSLNSFIVTIGLILVIVNIFFKLGVFPAVQYVADVYEVSHASGTYFFISVVKPAFFMLLIKWYFITFPAFFLITNPFIWLCCICSALYSAILIFEQKSLKKIFGYASINQYAFFLLALTSGSFYNISLFYFYFITYSLACFICFFIFVFFKNNLNQELSTINDLKVVSNNNALCLFFLLAVFTMAGLPPFDLFFFKFHFIISLVHQNMYFAVFIQLVSNIVIVGTYLTMVRALLWEQTDSIIHSELTVDKEFILYIVIIFSFTLISIFSVYISSFHGVQVVTMHFINYALVHTGYNTNSEWWRIAFGINNFHVYRKPTIDVNDAWWL